MCYIQRWAAIFSITSFWRVHPSTRSTEKLGSWESCIIYFTTSPMEGTLPVTLPRPEPSVVGSSGKILSICTRNRRAHFSHRKITPNAHSSVDHSGLGQAVRGFTRFCSMAFLLLYSFIQFWSRIFSLPTETCRLQQYFDRALLFASAIFVMASLKREAFYETNSFWLYLHVLCVRLFQRPLHSLSSSLVLFLVPRVLCFNK